MGEHIEKCTDCDADGVNECAVCDASICENHSMCTEDSRGTAIVACRDCYNDLRATGDDRRNQP